MEMSLDDLRAEAMKLVKRKFDLPDIIAQPHVGIILRRGTVICTVTIYESELIENKDRFERFIEEKTYDAAAMLRVSPKR